LIGSTSWSHWQHSGNILSQEVRIH
jgi:hypothetical protein